MDKMIWVAEVARKAAAAMLGRGLTTVAFCPSATEVWCTNQPVQTKLKVGAQQQSTQRERENSASARAFGSQCARLLTWAHAENRLSARAASSQGRLSGDRL